MQIARRKFLAACGLSGLLYASNWKTLFRGPQSGDVAYYGCFKVCSKVIGIAGEKLEFGQCVYHGADGRYYAATAGSNPVGIALSNVSKFTDAEIATSGEVRIGERKHDVWYL